MKLRLLGLSLLFFFLSACGGNPATHPLSGELEKLDNFQEEFKEFKLPTELPFQIDHVIINNMEKLPPPLDKHELSVAFIGEQLEMEIHLLENIPLDTASGENEHSTVLKNGQEAKYFYNGNTQILRWNDEDFLYGILVYVDGEEKYTVEELVGIADSFEVYN